MKSTLNYIFTTSLTLLLSFNLLSQSYGIGAGINISQLNFNSADNVQFEDYRSLLGLNMGFYYAFKFSKNMGLRLGLAYSLKGFGYKSEYDSSLDLDNVSTSYVIESETRLSYIQLHPMFKYTLPLGEENTFYAMMGPYISVGITGALSERQNYSYIDYIDPMNNINIDNSNTEEVQFGQDGGGFDYVNYGFTPVIGLQLHSFFIEVSYDIGLNDIQTNNEDDFKAYDRTFSIKIGYLFGK